MMKHNEALALMQNAGLKITSIKFGKMQRVATNSHPNSKNGWYILSEFNGEVWGKCGNYAIGLEQSMPMGAGVDLPENWHEELAKKIKRDEEEKKLLADKAAIEANRIWGMLRLTGTSGYVDRKKIIPYGARYGTRNTIAVPLLNEKGFLRGLQVIYSEKDVWASSAPDKRYFPKGIDKKGCFFPITDYVSDQINIPLIISEGYATACSIYQATGLDVVCAFDAYNIISVARAIRMKLKDKEIIIVADDDKVGIDQANAAAKEVRARVIQPKFYYDRDPKWNDFNDIHVNYGLDEVRRQFSDFLGLKL